MSSNDRVIDRVRKLLDLANHPATSEEEAFAAMSRVNVVLAKYNLDMAAVLKADRSGEDKVVHTKMGDYEKPGTYVRWSVTLCAAAAELNFCDYYYNATSKGWIHNLVGRKVNVTVTELTYHYLMQSVKRLAKEDAKSKGLTGNRASRHQHSFCKGATNALHHRCFDLAEIRRCEETIVRHSDGTKSNLPALASLYEQEKKAIDEFKKEHFITIKTGRSRNTKVDIDAYVSGKEAGKKISLQDQVAADKPSGYLH